MMLYQKPKDVRYVDMAIWIDNNAYEEDFDSETMFEYIYLLTHMLARKRGLFDQTDKLDDFTLFASSRYYLRLTDKRQFEYNEDGTYKFERIKSILNYIKKSLYMFKVMYEKETYLDTPKDEIAYDTGIASILLDTVDRTYIAEFDCYLHDIISTIKNFLYKIPYRNDKVMMNRIYISCLLSFLNSITLSKGAKKRVRILNEMQKANAIKYVNDIYANERYDSTILFNLDDSMKDYITVLVNCIRKLIASDLSEIVHSHIPTDMCMKDLLCEAMYDVKENDE